MRKESLRVLGIEVSRDFSVKELLNLSCEELMDPHLVSKVSVIRELCEEFCAATADEEPSIRDSADAVGVLAPHLKYLDHEECWVLFLNRANKILMKLMMSSGTVSSCQIDVARITKMAIVSGASGIILSHNHPSGNPRPGIADIEMTKRLRDALKTFEIALTDHIILADGEYFSFAEDNVYAMK